MSLALQKGHKMHSETFEIFSWATHLAPIGIGAYALRKMFQFQNTTREVLETQHRHLEEEQDTLRVRMEATQSVIKRAHREIDQQIADLLEKISKQDKAISKSKKFEEQATVIMGEIAQKTVETKKQCFSHVQQLARSHQFKQNAVDSRLEDLEHVNKMSLKALEIKRSKMDAEGMPEDLAEFSEK